MHLETQDEKDAADAAKALEEAVGAPAK